MTFDITLMSPSQAHPPPLHAGDAALFNRHSTRCDICSILQPARQKRESHCETFMDYLANFSMTEKMLSQQKMLSKEWCAMSTCMTCLKKCCKKLLNLIPFCAGRAFPGKGGIRHGPGCGFDHLTILDIFWLPIARTYFASLLASSCLCTLTQDIVSLPCEDTSSSYFVWSAPEHCSEIKWVSIPLLLISDILSVSLREGDFVSLDQLPLPRAGCTPKNNQHNSWMYFFEHTIISKHMTFIWIIIESYEFSSDLWGLDSFSTTWRSDASWEVEWLSDLEVSLWRRSIEQRFPRLQREDSLLKGLN